MELYQYQQTACGLLEETDRNLLVIAPTGAGKTEVGYRALAKYGKGVYIAPTRALCYEKGQELGRLFPNKRVVIGNKDYSLGKNLFRRSDFRVMTPWKLNQLMQNSWFCDQSPVIIFDEIHGLSADFEIIITKLKEMFPSVRLVGLSATVSDEDEAKFASWLNALVVKSTERPVPLVERVVFFDVNLNDVGEELIVVKVYENGSLWREFSVSGELNRSSHLELIYQFIREQDDSPCLWFSPYRGRAVEMANFLISFANEADVELSELANNLTGSGSEFSQELKSCLPFQSAFHHGGLSQQERELVFEQAQAGKLKNIATCFTLSQGVNLPARHIVFDTIYDYDNDGDSGSGDKRLMDISVFRQLEGRAGRPQFDNIGYVWIPVFSEVEKVEVEEVLLKYKASKLESRIFNTYFLTSTVPQLVQFGFDTAEKIAGFIKATFWGKATQDPFPLMNQIQGIISSLIGLKVVRIEDGRLVLSREGSQIAKLAIHPNEYFEINALVKAEELDFRCWVEDLIRVCAEYVIKQCNSEKIEACVEDLSIFGLSVYTAKSKHFVRDMADYISRLFDITRSYFRLNSRMDDFEERWEKAVAEKFLFGELQLAQRLSEILRRDQLKRLIRNVGAALADCAIYDEPTQRSIAKLLFGQYKSTPNGLAAKVAEVIGVEPERFYALVEEERTKKNVKREEVLA